MTKVHPRVFIFILGITLSLASPTFAGQPRGGHGGGNNGNGFGPRGASPAQHYGTSPSNHGGNSYQTQRQAPAAPRTASVPATMTRGGTTYTQHMTAVNGQQVLQRTSVRVVNGSTVVVNRNYYSTDWGGHPYWAYHYYWGYHPWFWGYYWAPFWNPWPFTWWWSIGSGAPWYVSWGWYYHPYATYAGPDYWVTDYVVSDMLADSYQRGYVAGQNAQTSTSISGPVKEQLRDEVNTTAKSFQNEKSLDLQRAFENPQFLFAVDTTLTVMPVTGTSSCTLTEGDLLRAAQTVDQKSAAATMTVVTSKGGSCAAGTQVLVSFNDLQEMLNAFSQRVDDGLHEFEKHKNDVKSKAEAPAPSAEDTPSSVEAAPAESAPGAPTH